MRNQTTTAINLDGGVQVDTIMGLTTGVEVVEEKQKMSVNKPSQQFLDAQGLEILLLILCKDFNAPPQAQLKAAKMLHAYAMSSSAALRAIEIGADIVLKATKVDGVYSADPVKDPSAVRFDQLGYDQVIESKLGVMDANAIVLCRGQNMPIRVFNMFDEGNLVRIMKGQPIGTLVS